MTAPVLELAAIEAAGAVVSAAMARPEASEVGVFGTGEPAADIVITTTAAIAPVLAADAIQPGAHITGIGTGIGTDMPHKNELPAALFARAADIAAGLVLRDGVRRSATDVTVADLTGVGALDAAVASMVTAALVG